MVKIYANLLFRVLASVKLVNFQKGIVHHVQTIEKILLAVFVNLIMNIIPIQMNVNQLFPH